jgi:hypothetical protein
MKAISRKLWGIIGFVLLGLALMVSSSLVSWIRDQRRAARQEFPSNWKLDEIVAALTKSGSAAYSDLAESKPEAHVLTWKIEEDDRPWYVEECILWVHWLESNGRKHWTLAHVVRNPKPRPQGWGRGWELAIVYDAPVAFYRVFDIPPTNQDVYKFCRESWWEFGPDHRFRILEAGVCVEAWREVVGEEPTEFFGS